MGFRNRMLQLGSNKSLFCFTQISYPQNNLIDLCISRFPFFSITWGDCYKMMRVRYNFQTFFMVNHFVLSVHAANPSNLLNAFAQPITSIISWQGFIFWTFSILYKFKKNIDTLELHRYQNIFMFLLLYNT